LACLTINSVFNKEILEFKDEFILGDIHYNICKISKTTTHAYEMKFIQPSFIGDIIRFINPDGTMKSYIINNVLSPKKVCKSIHNQILLDPVIGMNDGGLVFKENLCLIPKSIDNMFYLTIYSNYDIQLQYIPAGINQPIKISPVPISMVDVFKIKPAINLSTLRNIEGFIGKPKVSVKVMAQATSSAGDGLAAKLYSQAKGDVPLPTIYTDNDIATVLHVDIAGRTFQSVVWQGNGTNLNNRELVFTEPSTGETFSINTKDLNSDITTLDSTIDTLAKPIEKLLSTTEFTQIRDIDIDNSESEIIDNNGAVIGNTKNMTASLNSCSFDNNQFEDFTIKEDLVTKGNIILTATINGEKFSCSAKTSKLKEEKALIFKASNGDILTINIGKTGIKSLVPENYAFVASSIKKSLMKIESGLDIKTGFDSDNVSKLVIANVSANKLYRNNQNEYVPKLDLLTMKSAKVALEVITNALNLMYSAQSNLQGKSDNLDRFANSLSSTIGVNKDASSGYLDTDLIEAASSFATALKSILAAVSTLQAGAKVADAGLEIIRSTSTT